MKQSNYGDHPGYEAHARRRFWAKVNRADADGCWTWTAYLDPAGYATFAYRGRRMRAHRYSYLVSVGPIPDGYDIDHMCRTRPCVRPDHLRAVTHRVNVLAGETVVAREASRTHCAKGHALGGDNLRYTSRGHRQCRTCARARWARADRVRSGRTRTRRP